MPEIKHNFTAGKMNKDIDERLVPNGEYRDAMNIQVRTTEGDGDTGVGNSGTVQNIPGNRPVKVGVHLDNAYASTAPGLVNRSRTVGSIADEKNNRAFFFVAGMDLDQAIQVPNLVNSTKLFIDTIYEVNTQNGIDVPTASPIVVDKWAVVAPNDDTTWTFAQPPLGQTIPALALRAEVISHLRVGMTVRAIMANGGNALQWGTEIQNIEIIESGEGEGIVWLYSEHPEIDWSGVRCLVFEAQRVLNFENPYKGKKKIISAINIIDNLLLWTDNQKGINKGEPKKINIDRCKEGSDSNMNLDVWTNHTQLKLTSPIDDSVMIDYSGEIDDNTINLENSLSPSINNDLREEHITVIRKPPRTAPMLEMSDSDRGGTIEVVGLEYDFYGIADENGDEFEQGYQTTITSPLFENPNSPNWQINDILVFTEEIGAEEMVGVIKATIDSIDFDEGTIQVTILSVNSAYTAMTEVEGSGIWEVALEQDKPLFELKFGRFACRYKYEDGEYSSFSPWSELAFLPGRFDYNYKKGYNLGMVNTLRSLKIKDFIPHQRTRNADIVAVDILYKNTESPNVYVVRTITRGIDPEWDLFTPTFENDGALVFGELTITSEMIHKTVEKNQLLRAWDNVPRYALAQEIAANRIMYSNYTQGYEVGHVGLEQALISDNTATMMEPKKSIKSMRNYKFGMVFGDKYGRETTVIANGYITGSSVNNYSMVDGDVYVDVEFASMKNLFQLKQVWDSEGSSGVPDEWMEYVKYYIKETSNEYYNLIMDRWYEAEDGNVWLSFVSADRNKVDLETYLVLKNGHGSNEPIIQEARYKILAIEEEAPDFIKVDDRFMGKILLSEDDYPFVFSSGATTPTAPDTFAPYLLMTESTITISEASWNNFLQNYAASKQGDLKVRVVGRMGGVELESREWKTVTYFSTGSGNGLLRWNGTFGETADMLDRFTNQGYDVSGLQYFLEFKEEVVTNTFPEFDGKFFVKVERDDVLETNVMVYNGLSTDYDNTGAYLLGFISTQPKHPAPTGPRNGYSWFSTEVVNGIDPVDSPGDTNPEGEPFSDYNSEGHNIAPLYGCVNNWPIDNQWEGPGQISFNREWGVRFFALGCDATVADNLGGNFNGEGYDENGNWGDCCGDGYFTFANWGSNRVVNFAHPTRQYWEWIQNHVHGIDEGDGRTPNENAVGYKMFIDNARLKNGKLTGSEQTGPNSSRNKDYATNDRNRNYYRPTGMDRGYQSGPGFNQVPANEYGRIFISTHTADGMSGTMADPWGFYSNPNTPEAQFKNHMTQEGNMFRFKDCPGDEANPDGYIYRVVGAVDFLSRGKNASKFGWQYGPTNDGYGGSSSYTANAAFESYVDDWSVAGDNVPGAAIINDYQGGVDINTAAFFNSLDVVVGGDAFGPYGGSDCGDCGADYLLDAGLGFDFCHREGFRVEFRRVNTATNNLDGNGDVGIDPAVWDPTGEVCHDGREAMYIYTVGSNITGGEIVQPVKDAAVFETEPKEDVGLDIYYEASNAIPMYLTSENTPHFAPYHSKVTLKDTDGLTDISWPDTFENVHVFHLGYTEETSIIGIKYDDLEEFGETFLATFGDNGGFGITVNRHLVFEHKNGTKTMSKVTRYMQPYDPDNVNNTSEMLFVPSDTPTGYYEIDTEVWQYPIKLSWFNCYSFGNGVESDRIRDDFNAPTIDNGVKVSTTFLDYGQEFKGSTIIYSGIYNSISGVNNLNEFNMAEKITKDLNPSYGSIQALKTRDTDVIVLTEDKTLKVTTHKDALYNADGNAQLLASNRVLGTAVPFHGDYGISNNPESLAWDEYRIYYTDKQRGAVLRLSGNGITPVSNVGMKTWFRDNLRQNRNLLGTFDVINGEYNLTTDYMPTVDKKNVTISFNETSKGWVSFKSFVPEEGVSVSGKYFTSVRGEAYEHDVDVEDTDPDSSTFGQIINRNTFYNSFRPSSIDIMFNEMPGSVKTFRTVNYEGSQAKITQMTDTVAIGPNNTTVDLPLGDGEYYNLSEELGWYVKDIETDMSSKGSVEFKSKEGKWFNTIDGDDRSELTPQDLSEFSVQGIGFMGTGNNMGSVTVTTTGTSTTSTSNGDSTTTTITTTTNTENEVVDGNDGDTSVGTDQNNDDNIADSNDDDNTIPLPTITVTLQSDETNNTTPDSTPNITDS